ncbi:MobF family relaxase [Litorilituus lipolyticus]|uniref:Conjugative relaxase n=1 Tax=Litorilituus lipolyticus TaxID=2491017 RepID=A0A502KNW8_9GAMM|nr:MobF family relaxase [Litorilituus lipolyticus]TPH13262.1 conjugative relaxase [Litorilituus lipolyticus]
MLTLSAINNIEYYKNIDQDDYYISEESLGIWHGKLKKHFKLPENVNTTHFDNLLNSKHPSCGKELFNSNQNIKRVGWDLTFSAPKSISLLWATANEKDRNEISAALLQAVKYTIDYLEKYLAGIKRGKNGICKEDAQAILSALIVHYTSRELDPQLHVHTIIPNCAKSKSGKLMALDSRKIYMNQKILGIIFRCQFAKELMALGYELEKDEESFRCSKIPKYLEAEFSTRANQINKVLKDNNIKSSASKGGDLIKLTTRKKKQAIKLSDLFITWKNKINSIKDRKEEIKEKSDIPESAIKRITASKSSFTRQQLEYEILIDEMLSGKNIIDLKRTINTEFESEELVLISNGQYSDYFTTQQILTLEKELLDILTDLANKQEHAASAQELSDAIDLFKHETGFIASYEQTKALEHACLSADFSIVQGSAGAGKSTVMRSINILYKKKGKKILGATVVKKAANNLMNETGIHSVTIAKIQHLILNNDQSIKNIDVLIIDEAGQVSTTALLDITKFAYQNNIKLILTGEDKQLDSINLGGSLSYISEKLGCYRIEKIQRQTTPLGREIVANFRDGNAKSAFTKLGREKLLNFSNSAQESQEKLMSCLVEYIENPKNKQYIVLASRWSKVDEISTLIRQHLKSKNAIENDEYTRSCIVSNHKCELEFSVGDTVRFSRNDYKLGVINGTTGIIKSLKEIMGILRFEVLMDSNQIVYFSEEQYQDETGNLQLSHGYASTIYSAQGATVAGDSFILWDSSMHKSLTYVAGSRHKQNSQWFFNNAEIEEFRKTKSQSSLDIVSEISSQDRQKKLATKLIDNIEQKATLKLQLPKLSMG